ncbi:hypothetical protein DSO57_1029852 [Entomophthora muscae]|uniref:Uncharacterized protein n=1 Tax=Entomophthora muscae TaxID=34485 RepID=A0ACC2RS07_9FUNG|nr:hypothetical protein DSO57_1029852 [Entomophthora muscae]
MRVSILSLLAAAISIPTATLPRSHTLGNPISAVNGTDGIVKATNDDPVNDILTAISNTIASDVVKGLANLIALANADSLDTSTGPFLDARTTKDAVILK